MFSMSFYWKDNTLASFCHVKLWTRQAFAIGKHSQFKIWTYYIRLTAPLLILFQSGYFCLLHWILLLICLDVSICTFMIDKCYKTERDSHSLKPSQNHSYIRKSWRNNWSQIIFIEGYKIQNVQHVIYIKLPCLHKTCWGTTKKSENKNLT